MNEAQNSVNESLILVDANQNSTIDMIMPLMDGETAISTLQIINLKVQIIAMSGLARSEALLETTGIGIQGFLAKPFTANQLLNFVQTIFR
ncbi:MAG: response regulator [Nostoc sp.]|uniref:response regulator n=1 Tax=unclassified Nostoc TaxID=2593658 RepID=UPI0025F08AEF|nr:response regulator [Nostoc sp. NMS9]